MSAAALFVPLSAPQTSTLRRVRATELTRGPWDPGAQHGGAPAALLMAAFEALPVPEGLALARVTYELLRPVPIAELELSAEISRPGRRVQLLEGSLRGPSGAEVVRARALRVRRAVIGELDAARATPPAGPDSGRPNDFAPGRRPMFAPDAVEIRFIAGGFGGGASTAWFRLSHPVLAGASATPLQQLAAAADFGNGISSPLPMAGHLFINPDLTIYIEREPVGEWICLEANTRIPAGGVGVAESVLYDQRGRVGRATQALLVAPR